MEKITSFTIDHEKLQPGLYVSRQDRVGEQTVTTFDLRLTSPNEEPVMNTAEVHTIEHLAATYLRNRPDWKDSVLYFGPMGCRTGFYLLLVGALTSEQALPLVADCFDFIAAYTGEIPGASPRDCGNYLDMNLPMARYWAGRYAALLKHAGYDRLHYPESGEKL
ncbi:MAG: S-ribosylhomocysteine lyase [Firmicutes bacterium]|nr:S-ribosylhomocysteine lyase [Bacillota bacterium]